MDLITLADKITELYLRKLKLPKIVKWLIAPEVSFKILKILLSNYHKVKDGEWKVKNYISLKKIVKEEIKKVKPVLKMLVEAQPYYGRLIKEAKKTNQPQVLIEFLEKYKNSTPKKVEKTLFQDIENMV